MHVLKRIGKPMLSVIQQASVFAMEHSTPPTSGAGISRRLLWNRSYPFLYQNDFCREAAVASSLRGSSVGRESAKAVSTGLLKGRRFSKHPPWDDGDLMVDLCGAGTAANDITTRSVFGMFGKKVL